MSEQQDIHTCLIGDPVSHSVSDIMFKYYAEISGIEPYLHLKFRVKSDDPRNLQIAIEALRVLGMRGANITLPYKIDVIRYLDEIDQVAARIGDVNTVVNTGDRLSGHNTDSNGALLAIERHMKK